MFDHGRSAALLAHSLLALCLLLRTPVETRRTLSSQRHCGRANNAGPAADQRIVNGWVVSPHRYPWMGSLAIQDPHDKTLAPMCGCSLITRQHVLTAAHCTTMRQDWWKPGDELVPFVIVLLGLHDLRKWRSQRSAVVRTVAKVSRPSSDNDAGRHDITVLTLNEPVRFSRFVRPVCLPVRPSDSTELVGQTLVVIGWGLTEPNGDVSVELRASHMKVQSRDVCAQHFVTEIDPLTLCLGNPQEHSGACYGDSGGPAMRVHRQGIYTIEGIVSYAKNDLCALDLPEVFTKVDEFLDFIHEVTRSTKRHAYKRRRIRTMRSARLR